ERIMKLYTNWNKKKTFLIEVEEMVFSEKKEDDNCYMINIIPLLSFWWDKESICITFGIFTFHIYLWFGNISEMIEKYDDDYDENEIYDVDGNLMYYEDGCTLLDLIIKHKHELRYADLHGITLSLIDLSYANLEGADLSYTNLRSADLTGAILRGANLFNADLECAILDDIDLEGVDLEGVDLTGVKK
ncbi:MAG: pentapeptide repeat-containing protein, partial [Nitrososphaerales archaeon]